MVTQLPGFADGVQEAQQTFRALLEALARPGRIQTLSTTLKGPPGLSPACGAACLTLLDLDTRLWAADLSEAGRRWLVFHTGCQLVERPEAADFAIVAAGTAPPLTDFSWGQGEFPEASTTLLVEVAALTGGRAVALSGPGIPDAMAVAPQVPPSFWEQWAANHQAYPLGLDAYLLSADHLMGLPRTTAVATA